MHMTLIQRHSQPFRFGRTIGASLSIAALAATVGCGVRDGNTVSAQPLAADASQQAGSPVVVSCEPTQRTLVRPVVVNGMATSQVECVTNALVSPAAQAPQLTTPARFVDYQQPVRNMPVVYEDLPEARVVRSDRPATVVPARQVVYREPVRKSRSVTKSAIIIGSSAGAGAGVGALIGGKKGALIGAAVGGGGATLWDQITRRKN
jgi:hypothetical protein